MPSVFTRVISRPVLAFMSYRFQQGVEVSMTLSSRTRCTGCGAGPSRTINPIFVPRLTQWNGVTLNARSAHPDNLPCNRVWSRPDDLCSTYKRYQFRRETTQTCSGYPPNSSARPAAAAGGGTGNTRCFIRQPTSAPKEMGGHLYGAPIARCKVTGIDVGLQPIQ